MKDQKIYFTTLSINGFNPVFKDFPYLNFLIIDCFNFYVKERGVIIYAFVIMRDHLHIVWKIPSDKIINDLISNFKSYTAKRIKDYLKNVRPEYLNFFISQRTDRKFKLWNLRKGNIIIHSLHMLAIKIRYIHNNPTKGEYKVFDDPTNYYFSSAAAYEKQASNFKFLTVREDIVPWY